MEVTPHGSTGSRGLDGTTGLLGWQLGRVSPMPQRLPAGWELLKLTSVTRLESGHTPSTRHPEYWDGNIPWVSLHDSTGLDVREIHSTAQTIGRLGLEHSSARLLPKGTVVFSRTATVGKATVLGREMATSQDFANFVCGDRLHNHYLVHLFRFMAPEWKRLMAGSTHNSIYMPVFQDLKILLPPKNEQEAIAEALSDADALIESLEKLSAKKRDIKQGAMQGLLTGRRRLRGFGGGWGVVPLANLVSADRFAIVDGPFGTQMKIEEYVSCGVPVIEMEHLVDGPIATELDRFITSMKFDEVKRSAVHPGDIVLSKTGSLGHLGIVPDGMETAIITSRLAKITLNPDRADRSFVFQYLVKLRSDGYWERVSQGGTMQILGIRMLKNVPVPNISVLEQQAIASILGDMDAEIAAVRAKLAKARHIKQGMMQELLTGRIRLV